jgi:NADH-quinone oxidoreductase subunit G
MVKVTIDGELLEVREGMTVLQACEMAGKEIPRFCYHEKLAIAGNCRMCLVEVEKTPKPQASCAYPVAEGMVIKTNTPAVKKAREGVLEFLLINHPLDCPICDQGGECDLQDEVYMYGRGTNRFKENKRAVEDKDFGPLIETHMTRCIHCTRCIRFSTLIAGVEDLGATGRGEDMEVGTYVGKAVSSELSGNMIDICPVGALTSKPYSFKARSWELKKTESIDIHDAVGSNIRVDAKGKEVMRILPRTNDLINEEWISDKTRFACDGLKMQRLDRCYVKKAGKLQEASWQEALAAINEKVKKSKPEEIAAISGNLADLESSFVLKNLMDEIGSKHMDCRTYGEKFDASNRMSYLFNTSIEGIEKSDLCLIVGANIRYDAPLVNARIRKRFLQGNYQVSVVGETPDLTYDVNNLGNDPQILEEIIAGKHEFCTKLKNAKNPLIIVGVDAALRADGAVIIAKCQEIANSYNMIRDDWNGFNVLNKASGRVGALDVGFVPGKNGKDLQEILAASLEGEIKLVFMLGGDEIETEKLKKSFVVYIGHHGDNGAHIADVILPASAYTEKNATYVNLEGRVQRTKLAVFAPGEAKEDWVIVNEIALTLGYDLGYKTLSELRRKIITKHEFLGKIGQIEKPKWAISGTKAKLSKEKIVVVPYNFYMTDAICRASKTMAECTKTFLPGKNVKKEKVA